VDQQERYAEASIRFDPLSVTVIILVVMAIAFLTGTLPAARSKADPVESLRYE
jgi:putative ABC transport system permease protein